MRKPTAKKRSPSPAKLGGVIHTYQKYDPIRMPGPSGSMPDVLSAAFDHLMFHGATRPLTEEGQPL